MFLNPPIGDLRFFRHHSPIHYFRDHHQKNVYLWDSGSGCCQGYSAEAPSNSSRIFRTFSTSASKLLSSSTLLLLWCKHVMKKIHSPQNHQIISNHHVLCIKKNWKTVAVLRFYPNSLSNARCPAKIWGPWRWLEHLRWYPNTMAPWVRVLATLEPSNQTGWLPKKGAPSEWQQVFKINDSPKLTIQNSTSRCFIHRFQIQLCFPFQVSFRQKKLTWGITKKIPRLLWAALRPATAPYCQVFAATPELKLPMALPALPMVLSVLLPAAGRSQHLAEISAETLGNHLPILRLKKKTNCELIWPRSSPSEASIFFDFFCCHCLSISNSQGPSARKMSPPSLASRCAKAALAKSCASSRKKKRTTPTFHLNCWKSHCHYLSANHNLLNGKYVKRETLRSHPSCGIP